MGSRPCRPVLVSLKFGLSPLVINENTHKIWLVDFPQAKLTWLGSETTLGFWQALLISFCTTATLAGHEAPGRNTTRISTVRPTTAAATHIAIFCLRPNLPRGTGPARGAGLAPARHPRLASARDARLVPAPGPAGRRVDRLPRSGW